MKNINKTILVLLIVGISLSFAAWAPLEIVPTSPGSKAVKDGGALVTHGSLLYAFQGGNSQNFFAFDPSSGHWAMKCSIPFDSIQNPNNGRWRKIKNCVKNGGALVSCGNYIYAFKGGNKQEFWMYDPSGNAWSKKCSIPKGTENKKVSNGGALVAYDGCIYAFKGGNTDVFWMYDPDADAWTPKAPLITSDGVKIKNGGALVTDNNKIYAFVGGNTRHFYSYVPDAWTQEPIVNFGPDSIKLGKQIKDGAAMTFYDNKIYAFKGGNTQSFGYYDLTLSTWFTLDTIPQSHPLTTEKKRINHGGSLANFDGIIYALKGNNTKQFWSYTP